MLRWRALRIPAGFLLLGVGAIGVFLPILPTTPFILLAAACFSCNKKLYGWLCKNSFFREHMVNYKERGGLKPLNVIISLSFLWATLIISMIVIAKPWSFFLLCAVGAAVTVHLFYMARPRSKT